ncbi:peptidase [Clostridium sp. chh4-2]|uniref:S8 family peptidase n=1 Tax=Clostridium sp. chh4-2 TaxID=2067550 RepID=UPI000CCECE4E|nr:S8 family peptidase [Clostridium sp. chh4-2]PNV60003.1 peptidase [Clostridium sp. chh4-2]
MEPCSADITSEDYADFIYRHTSLPLEELYRIYDSPCIDFINRELLVIYRPLQDVLPLSLEKYSYETIPKLYSLLDTSSMDASGITDSRAQPAFNSSGEGVIIGIIDTGIDYTNPLFQNPDGTTRILGIWDQTLPENGPGGVTFGFDYSLLYGQEFTEIQINEALASPDPLSVVPSMDTNGHGTFLAGIAGGGETEDGSFFGAAPSCRLGIVKLKPAKQYLRDFYGIREDAIAYQENDILTGIRYLLNLSYLYTAPLVLLLGLGTNSGSHSGTSSLGLFFRQISLTGGVASVIAAGNETGFRHHFLGSIREDESYEEVELRIAEGERGLTVELWAREAELYTVGFITPSGEQIERIPVLRGNETRINLLLEQTVITVNYITSEMGSGSQLVFIRFETPAAGLWRIRVYNSLFITGQYHMWLPVHGFISDDTVFLRSNPDTTITEPGNSPAPITVSAYNHQNGSIYIHSSRGFSRDGGIKPELAAPGVDVYGPGLGRDTENGRVFPMTRRTGTSVAAAHVAGAAAVLLGWGLKNSIPLSIYQPGVKSYLVRGASRNPAYTYPNREFGYGTLDLFNSLLRFRE